MYKVKYANEEIILDGDVINVNDKAPVVNLVNSKLETVEVGGEKDYIQVFVTVPSLDTGVCQKETRVFNLKVSSYQNVKLYVISMDLPFAQNRFCTVEAIENVEALSDFRDHKFGDAYGIYCTHGKLEGLLSRCVFIVKNGLVIYKEILEEVKNEPNYDEIFKVLDSIS